MSAQTSGFRAACREQAGLAMSVFARFWGRYAPKGRGRIALRAGCLIFAPVDPERTVAEAEDGHGDAEVERPLVPPLSSASRAEERGRETSLASFA